MEVMKRSTWPGIMDGAADSVLVLAPWIDGDLVEELFSFLPPIDVRIVFPRSTLQRQDAETFRYALRGVLDTNFDAEIRVVDDEIAACLVVDDEEFYYSETYADRLQGQAEDTAGGIAYAHRVWEEGEPWS